MLSVEVKIVDKKKQEATDLPTLDEEEVLPTMTLDRTKHVETDNIFYKGETARPPILITYSRKNKEKNRITREALGEEKGQDHPSVRPTSWLG